MRIIHWCCLSLLTLPPLRAELLFPEAFQAARTLPSEQQESEYLRLAEGQFKPACKDAAFAAAAEAAARRKGFEDAEKHAAQIGDEFLRNATRMSLLAQQRKWAELLAFSGGFDLAAFPDALICPAALQRGTAHAHTGDRAAADSDLKLAIGAIAPLRPKLETQFAVATLYGTVLRDTVRELELLAEILPQDEAMAHFHRQRVHCRHAVLLAEAGRLDEAIRTLEAYPVDASSSRQFEVKLTLGDLYRQQGDKARAKALYEAAAAVENLSDNYARRAQARIATLAQ